MVKKQVIIATEAQIAKRFKIAERTVRECFKAARIGPAKYNFLECVDIYIEKTNVKDTESSDSQLNDSRTKLNNAKLAILEGDYVHIDEVSTLVSGMLFNFKNKILSLVKKIPPELFGKPEKTFEKIVLKHVTIAINELKEFKELLDEGEKDSKKSEGID